MLGHQRGDVRVMVLDLDDRGVAGEALERPAPRQVGRMGVDGDDLRGDAVHRLERGDAPLERLQSLEVLKVADVLAHPGVRAGGKAERALQLSADGEGGGERDRERHRQRRVPARAADRLLVVSDDPHDRVIARDVDLAVVGEERVGEIAQPTPRIIIIDADRLVRAVSGGGDDGAREAPASEPGTGLSNSSWMPEYASMIPRSGLPGATARETGAAGRRAASTIGRAGPPSDRRAASPSDTSDAASASSRTITANGLSTRPLRSRSRATASSSPASHVR